LWRQADRRGGYLPYKELHDIARPHTGVLVPAQPLPENNALPRIIELQLKALYTCIVGLLLAIALLALIRNCGVKVSCPLSCPSQRNHADNSIGQV
jgi:hypothetical protein